MPESPKTLKSLFDFYYDYVKLLYAVVSADNVLPQEVLFEIHAALDHVSRIYTYGESEEKAVAKAYGHLKRSCLDIFKIEFKKLSEQYADLMRVDISIVDNGDFEKNVRLEFAKIKQLAKEARQFEGKNSVGRSKPPEAFDKWYQVFDKGQKFEKDFLLSPKVDWARLKDKTITRKTFYLSVAASIVASLIVGAVSSTAIQNLFGP